MLNFLSFSFLASVFFLSWHKKNQKSQDDFQLAAAQTQNRQVLHRAKAIFFIALKIQKFKNSIHNVIQKEPC